MRKNYFLILLLFVFFSCKKTDNEHKDDEPVVKVFDYTLYKSELDGLTKGLSPDDSAKLAENFINGWIENHLFLHYAQTDLPKEEKEKVDKKTEDFKNSLLIHSFKENIVMQNADTIVTPEEIEEYYEAHSPEFKLDNSLIKGFFIKYPVSDTNYEALKNVLHSETMTLDDILQYVTTDSAFFEDFSGKWIRFQQVMMKIPYIVDNEEYFLQTHNFIETERNGFYYFLKINDRILKGSPAPLEFVKNDIYRLLEKQKSNAIVNEYKQNKYTEAKNNGDIIFY